MTPSKPQEPKWTNWNLKKWKCPNFPFVQFLEMACHNSSCINWTISQIQASFKVTLLTTTWLAQINFLGPLWSANNLQKVYAHYPSWLLHNCIHTQRPPGPITALYQCKNCPHCTCSCTFISQFLQTVLWCSMQSRMCCHQLVHILQKPNHPTRIKEWKDQIIDIAFLE